MDDTYYCHRTIGNRHSYNQIHKRIPIQVFIAVYFSLLLFFYCFQILNKQDHMIELFSRLVLMQDRLSHADKD